MKICKTNRGPQTTIIILAGQIKAYLEREMIKPNGQMNGLTTRHSLKMDVWKVNWSYRWDRMFKQLEVYCGLVIIPFTSGNHNACIIYKVKESC